MLAIPPPAIIKCLPWECNGITLSEYVSCLGENTHGECCHLCGQTAITKFYKGRVLSSLLGTAKAAYCADCIRCIKAHYVALADLYGRQLSMRFATRTMNRMHVLRELRLRNLMPHTDVRQCLWCMKVSDSHDVCKQHNAATLAALLLAAHKLWLFKDVVCRDVGNYIRCILATCEWKKAFDPVVSYRPTRPISHVCTLRDFCAVGSVRDAIMRWVAENSLFTTKSSQGSMVYFYYFDYEMLRPCEVAYLFEERCNHKVYFGFYSRQEIVKHTPLFSEYGLDQLPNFHASNVDKKICLLCGAIYPSSVCTNCVNRITK